MSKRVAIYARVSISTYTSKVSTPRHRLERPCFKGKAVKKIASEPGIGISTVQRVVHAPNP